MIRGKNGTGKSTLLSTLLRITPIAGGTIRVPVSWNEQGVIGFIPQEIPVFPGTLRDNLSLGLQHNDEQLLRTPEYLDWHQASLDVAYERMQLSGGQRQRIGVARVLLGGPYRAILVDEMEAGVDNPSRLIVALRRAAPLLIVISHSSVCGRPMMH